QASIAGFSNLYVGFNSGGTSACSGAAPTVKFAYTMNNTVTGALSTSPALSLDGTKGSFVESVTNASVFHVLTLATTGSNGTTPGTAASGSLRPGTVTKDGVTTTFGGNNAVDVGITLNGNVSVTRSSPFPRYGRNGTDDIVYVGDDSGKLHKFTGVFLGAPTEVIGSGWPFSVGATTMLMGPVFDSVIQHVFVRVANGTLYCVNDAVSRAASCGTLS